MRRRKGRNIISLDGDYPRLYYSDSNSGKFEGRVGRQIVCVITDELPLHCPDLPTRLLYRILGVPLGPVQVALVGALLVLSAASDLTAASRHPKSGRVARGFDTHSLSPGPE